MLEATLAFQNEDDTRFVFIGNGPGFDIIDSHIKQNNTQNILLLPLQPSNVFPFSIASADIGLVAQERGLETLFMPSKTYDMMAAGLAIIGISDGINDLTNLIRRYELGSIVRPGYADELVTAIRALKSNRNELARCKRNARAAIEKHLNPDRKSVV